MAELKVCKKNWVETKIIHKLKLEVKKITLKISFD